MANLSPWRHWRIKRLAAKGDALAAQRRYPDAVDLYRRAWSLLPDPKEIWSAATWLLVAIADAHFLSGEFGLAADTLERAKFCPEAIGNPFVHLRLGQALLETGKRDRALDELTQAYMAGGREIFDEEDPKYLAALATVLKPPPGQDSL